MTENKFYSKGSVIFKENTWELAMYDIVSGKVGIYSAYGTENEQLLTELEAGKYFGEMGVIDAMTRSATAVALEDSEVKVIESDDFEDYIRQDPEMVLDVFKKLCARFRELSDTYLDACSTVGEYLEAAGEKKPQGLLKKIMNLLTFNEAYATMLPKTYEELLLTEEMNSIFYY